MRRLVVHLVGGETVQSRVLTPAEEASADAEALKGLIKQVIQEDRSWYLDADLENGGYAIIPGDKVLWVEFQ